MFCIYPLDKNLAGMKELPQAFDWEKREEYVCEYVSCSGDWMEETALRVLEHWLTEGHEWIDWGDAQLWQLEGGAFLVWPVGAPEEAFYLRVARKLEYDLKEAEAYPVSHGWEYEPPHRDDSDLEPDPDDPEEHLNFLYRQVQTRGALVLLLEERAGLRENLHVPVRNARLMAHR